MSSRASRHLILKALLTLPFVLLGIPANAAQFDMEISPQVISEGDVVTVKVFLDTEGESINALEGHLLFPTDLLRISSIRDGGSIVTVWLHEPQSGATQDVQFSGITPGGVRGDHGFLFSVTFLATKEGSGAFSLDATSALKNDGRGTSAPVTNISSHFSILKTGPAHPQEETVDTEPPEPFDVTIFQSPDAFDGENMLVFAAHDKGSGVARYELCEGFFGRCVLAESPYPLSVRGARSFIKIKAFDYSDNMRVAHLFTVKAGVQYALYAILCGLVCGGALFALSRFRRG